jgi:branched-chain amino acid transport system substrate-binding protein
LLFKTDRTTPGESRRFHYLLIVCLLTLWACAPRRIPIPEERPPSPEIVQAQQRFEKAERLFREQAYSEALAIYQDHLSLFPKGPLADIALNEMGIVYMAMGDYREARKAFHRLVREYPRSSLVEDARLNVIRAYHDEGNYRAAINYANSLLRLAKTPQQRSRIHYLMGHTYCAIKQFRVAVEQYAESYRLGKPQERPDILSKVKETITYLQEPELHSLIDVYGDKFPSDYVRLQLATEYAVEGRIESAIAVLSDFIRLFPYHDELQAATTLIEELRSGPLVDRFSIGCILPLSGAYESFGNRALNGIELALSQFNARPDVNPIQLFIKDSRGDPAEASRAVESLVLDDRVIGIIGPMITSESAAIKAEALHVPIVTLTQKSDIAEFGDWVFRNFLTISLQVRALAAYTVQELGIERFAILYPEERYGISFMNRFWDEIVARGAELVAIESYTPDQTDFADAIKKLVGLYYPRPDEPEQEHIGQPSLRPQALSGEEEEPEPIIDFGAIFIPDTYEKVGLIAPQLPYYDVTDVLLLGTNLWHSDKLIEMAQKYVQGAIVPDGFFLDSPSPKVQDFRIRFEEVFDRPPGFLEAQAYDTALMLFHLVNQPEVRSRRTLKVALMEVRDFPGVTGLSSFDEKGDVDKQIYILQIRGAQFIQIRP